MYTTKVSASKALSGEPGARRLHSGTLSSATRRCEGAARAWVSWLTRAARSREICAHACAMRAGLGRARVGGQRVIVHAMRSSTRKGKVQLFPGLTDVRPGAWCPWHNTLTPTVHTSPSTDGADQRGQGEKQMRDAQSRAPKPSRRKTSSSQSSLKRYKSASMTARKPFQCNVRLPAQCSSCNAAPMLPSFPAHKGRTQECALRRAEQAGRGCVIS